MLAIPFSCNILALFMLEEAVAAFDDLGKLLLGGVIAAVVVAVGFTVVRFHIRDKKPATSNFISISATDEDAVN